MRPFTIGIELGSVGPRPGLIVIRVDLSKASLVRIHDLEDGGRILKGRRVVRQLLPEWIVGAPMQLAAPAGYT